MLFYINYSQTSLKWEYTHPVMWFVYAQILWWYQYMILQVYVYHKSLPMPVTSHRFGSIDPISGEETDDDNGLFVSSVCWRGKSFKWMYKSSTDGLRESLPLQFVQSSSFSVLPVSLKLIPSIFSECIQKFCWRHNLM